jgi:hypothetical protein
VILRCWRFSRYGRVDGRHVKQRRFEGMRVEQKLFDAYLRGHLAFENIADKPVDEVVGELEAQLGEIFARVGQIVAHERNEQLYVVDNGSDVTRLVTNHRYILPLDL